MKRFKKCFAALGLAVVMAMSVFAGNVGVLAVEAETVSEDDPRIEVVFGDIRGGQVEVEINFHNVPEDLDDEALEVSFDIPNGLMLIGYFSQFNFWLQPLLPADFVPLSIEILANPIPGPQRVTFDRDAVAAAAKPLDRNESNLVTLLLGFTPSWSSWLQPVPPRDEIDMTITPDLTTDGEPVQDVYIVSDVPVIDEDNIGYTFLPGDVDGNGIFTSADASLIAQEAVQPGMGLINHFTVADVTGNGIICMADSSAVWQEAVTPGAMPDFHNPPLYPPTGANGTLRFTGLPTGHLNAGDSFTLTMRLDGNTGFSALQTRLFVPDGLELTHVQLADFASPSVSASVPQFPPGAFAPIPGSGALATPFAGPGHVGFGWGLASDFTVQELLVFTFRVRPGAFGTLSPITFDLNTGTGEASTPVAAGGVTLDIAPYNNGHVGSVVVAGSGSDVTLPMQTNPDHILLAHDFPGVDEPFRAMVASPLGELTPPVTPNDTRIFDLTKTGEQFRSLEFIASTFNRLHNAGGQRFSRLSIELSDNTFIIMSYRIGPGPTGSIETVEAITHLPFMAGTFTNATVGGLMQNSDFAGQLGNAPSNLFTLRNDGAFDGSLLHNDINPFANTPESAMEYRVIVDIDINGNLVAEARVNDVTIRPPAGTPTMEPFRGEMQVEPGTYIRAVHAWVQAPGGPGVPGESSAHHMYMPVWAVYVPKDKTTPPPVPTSGATPTPTPTPSATPTPTPTPPPTTTPPPPPTPTPPPGMGIFGDADGNGIIDIRDVTLLRLYLVGRVEQLGPQNR